MSRDLDFITQDGVNSEVRAKVMVCGILAIKPRKEFLLTKDFKYLN